MKHLITTALLVLTVASAAAAQEPPAPPPAPSQTEATEVDLTIYSGTYALQAPARVIELRVYVDADGNLVGELVGPQRTQQTIFRADTPHKFLHGERDDIWVLFTVENGRATSVTMHQAGREISGPRNP